MLVKSLTPLTRTAQVCLVFLPFGTKKQVTQGSPCRDRWESWTRTREGPRYCPGSTYMVSHSQSVKLNTKEWVHLKLCLCQKLKRDLCQLDLWVPSKRAAEDDHNGPLLSNSSSPSQGKASFPFFTGEKCVSPHGLHTVNLSRRSAQRETSKRPDRLHHCLRLKDALPINGLCKQNSNCIFPAFFPKSKEPLFSIIKPNKEHEMCAVRTQRGYCIELCEQHISSHAFRTGTSDDGEGENSPPSS